MIKERPIQPPPRRAINKKAGGRRAVRRRRFLLVAMFALAALAILSLLLRPIGRSLRLKRRTATPFVIQPAAPVDGYRIVRSYPHDLRAFTQGLLYDKDFLYESTGLLGRSSLRKVELETGRVIQVRPLNDKLFGEGLARWNDRLIQLTWRSHIGFVYDLESFEPLREFTYKGEGWGITSDGTRLIMSNGSATLTFLDPQTLKPTGRLLVVDGGQPMVNLNELEFIRGEIYANVWQSDLIARIDPQTGAVRSWIDLSGLRAEMPAGEHWDVLNGIAYDGDHDRIFVTGKLWSRLFQIEIILHP